MARDRRSVRTGQRLIRARRPLGCQSRPAAIRFLLEQEEQAVIRGYYDKEIEKENYELEGACMRGKRWDLVSAWARGASG